MKDKDASTAIICCPDTGRSDDLASALARAGCRVLAQVASLRAHFDSLLEAHPDLIFVDDIFLGNNLETVARLSRAGSTVVVMVDPRFDGSLVVASLQNGVRGYLSVRDTPEQLSRSLESILQGGIVVSPRLGRLTWTVFAKRGPASQLSDLEGEVAILAAQGLGSSAIAEQLSIPVKEAGSVLDSILTKLSLNDPSAIAAYLATHGCLSIEQVQ